MNKVMLIGNLGRDPEMTYTPSGTAVTKFSLAVNRRSKSPSGDWQNETDWFNIIAWNQLAETCSSFLKKGSKVFVEGRLVIRKYNDRENIQRTAIEVVINEMEMLSPKEQQSGASGSGNFNTDGDDVLGDLDEHPF